MNAIYFFFLIVAAPLLIFVTVWTVVTACRLWVPKRPRPLYTEMLMARWERVGTENPVGVQEIHEAHRRRERERQAETPLYYLTNEPASRLPDEWIDDLWVRRN